MNEARSAEEGRLDHYECYLFGNVVPVRFKVDKQGERYGAERPGEAQGSLRGDPTLLSKLDFHPEDFTEIGEDEYNQRVREFETTRCEPKQYRNGR